MCGLRVLDLFSGIGGFSLGLERIGMKTVAFCEIDAKARKVLRKHWPDTPIFEDVTKLKKEDINEKIDIIAGGFPCQDISLAGKGAGLEGKRSGLWWEFHRLIKEIQPKYAIIENVAALRSRGLDEVLRSLAEIGYDAEWHCIPASAVGACHRRDRIWIVAYPESDGWVERDTKFGRGDERIRTWEKHRFGRGCETLAHSGSERLQGHEWSGATGTQRISERHLAKCSWWEIEPDVGRVADGVSGRVDRLKQLGNAVVPQIPELIGKAIIDYENAT